MRSESDIPPADNTEAPPTCYSSSSFQTGHVLIGSNTAQHKINDDKNESRRATLVESLKKNPEKTHDIGNEHDRSTLMLV